MSYFEKENSEKHQQPLMLKVCPDKTGISLHIIIFELHVKEPCRLRVEQKEEQITLSN
jgi:hypothetical protein